MSYKIVIPARYQSSRLPGKPLRDIAGQTMIERTYRNAQLSQACEVIIATDDERIAECVQQFGGEHYMTSDSHRSGSDRIYEVAKVKGWDGQTVVLNVQCDEPFIDAQALDNLAQCLLDQPTTDIATIASKHQDSEGYQDPHNVKVVCDSKSFALYFSRTAIPHGANEWLCHHGIYAYRCEYLKRFTALEQMPIEKYESLEQLRALSARDSIYVQLIEPPSCFGIDDEEGLVKANALYKN